MKRKKQVHSQEKDIGSEQNIRSYHDFQRLQSILKKDILSSEVES